MPIPSQTPTGAVADILWKDLLDGDACTTCGRCTAVCPATAAGKALDPRSIVLGLSKLVDSQTVAGKELVPSAFDNITDRALWDCTTCGACVYECPVNIEVYDKIIDLRRQLIDIGRVRRPCVPRWRACGAEKSVGLPTGATQCLERRSQASRACCWAKPGVGLLDRLCRLIRSFSAIDQPFDGLHSATGKCLFRYLGL